MMKFLFSMILVTVSAMAHSTPITVVNRLSEAQKKEMVTVLANHLKNQRMPSIVAAATRGNHVMWFEALGYQDYDNKVEAHPYRSLYRWASVSKLATARMAYALSEDGVLKLDEAIGNGAGNYYFPILGKLKYLKRCFTPSGLHEYFSCTQKYGNPKVLKNIRGSCFDATEFGPSESDKGYLGWISDKTKSSGDFVMKNKDNDERCRVRYSITQAELDADDPVLTVKDLLSHRGGIIHYSHLGMEAEPNATLLSDVNKIKDRKNRRLSQMAWAISAFFPKYPLLGRPGQLREYSSFGYNLAGVIMEHAARKNFEDILEGYTSAFGASSIQPDYLGLSPEGVAPGNVPFVKTKNYRLKNGKIVLNNYTTDNSYKLAGGGIMSNVVDLARFCVAITNDGHFTKKGAPSIQHSGSHPNHTKSLLVSKANKDNNPQCLVLMTNVEHEGIDLEKVRSELEKKLKAFGYWKD